MQQPAIGDLGNTAEKWLTLENVVSQMFFLLDSIGVIVREIDHVAGSSVFSFFGACKSDCASTLGTFGRTYIVTIASSVSAQL